MSPRRWPSFFNGDTSSPFLARWTQPAYSKVLITLLRMTSEQMTLRVSFSHAFMHGHRWCKSVRREAVTAVVGVFSGTSGRGYALPRARLALHRPCAPQPGAGPAAHSPASHHRQPERFPQLADPEQAGAPGYRPYP